MWMWEAVCGGCQRQPWYNDIILTPQVTQYKWVTSQKHEPATLYPQYCGGGWNFSTKLDMWGFIVYIYTIWSLDRVSSTIRDRLYGGVSKSLVSH